MKGFSRAVMLGLVLFLLSAVSSGQDRDVSAGSSSGSIRPDVLDTDRGSRTRVLSVEKRAHLVGQFGVFRGVETLVGGTSFEDLKDSYTAILDGLVNQKGVAADLTPGKYLTFRIMARDLSKQKPGVNTDALAQGIINSYVRTGDFMPPILAAGFTKREGKKAESNAVSSLRLLRKQH